jgi:hypothetical protein
VWPRNSLTSVISSLLSWTTAALIRKERPRHLSPADLAAARHFTIMDGTKRLILSASGSRRQENHLLARALTESVVEIAMRWSFLCFMFAYVLSGPAIADAFPDEWYTYRYDSTRTGA